MGKVFLSYNRADSLDFARELHRRFVRDGIDCFFDESSIEWGDNYVLALEDALNECDHIIIILSPGFVSSEWTTVERTSTQVDDPANLRRKILPLLYRPCDLPRFLKPIQYLDVTTHELLEEYYPVIRKKLGVKLQPDAFAVDSNRMERTVRISVKRGDALQFETDVLALKYAQSLYGVDGAVFNHLEDHGLNVHLPKLGDIATQATEGCMGSSSVLFVGVNGLRKFGYPEIRDFSRNVILYLAEEAPRVKHLALTIHGPGYGLDEIEAFESELAGILDAANVGNFPPALESITFIEKSAGRAERLSAALMKLLPDGLHISNGHGSTPVLVNHAQSTLLSAGYTSADKPHVFVAMPFTDNMDDIFHYGLQSAVNGAGLLCERADLSAFTGDVMDWVRTRISSATLVVADLSTANPNVYLEVGYAWGCRVPTVLLVREENDLMFDVKGQRCIMYKSIKSLEDALRHELKGLLAKPGAMHVGL